MTYIEITFLNTSKETGEILIALLSGLQYEGFEEEPDCLKAFIQKTLFNEEELKKTVAQFQLKYALTELPNINWNKEWESNFQPVIIENFCAVRAVFHQPIKNVQHEIIITPKMSFGTGHHATTFMMIQQMQKINFLNKHVMDFGTGTGVLAILAYKSGAASVIAIDNDSNSIENARENFERNDAAKIDLQLAEIPLANNTCNIILANITRNVIQDNFTLFNQHLSNNGILLLSGLLKEDENDISSLAVQYKFSLSKKLQKENWICLKLVKE